MKGVSVGALLNLSPWISLITFIHRYVLVETSCRRSGRYWSSHFSFPHFSFDFAWYFASKSASSPISFLPQTNRRTSYLPLSRYLGLIGMQHFRLPCRLYQTTLYSWPTREIHCPISSEQVSTLVWVPMIHCSSISPKYVHYPSLLADLKLILSFDRVISGAVVRRVLSCRSNLQGMLFSTLLFHRSLIWICSSLQLSPAGNTICSPSLMTS